MSDVDRRLITTAAPSPPRGDGPPFSLPSLQPAVRFLVAAAAALAGIAVWWLLTPLVEHDHAFLLPLLAVIYVAWHGGYWPAVLTLGLSAAGVWGVVSRGGAIPSPQVVGLGLFCVGGVCCALLGESQRSARRR